MASRRALRFRASVAVVSLLFVSSLHGAAAELADARRQFLSGQYSNCIATCREAIADYSYQEEWHELITRAQFVTGDYEGAGRSISNALQRFSWSVPLRLLARDVFPYTAQSNRVPEMLEEVERLIGSRSDWRYRDAASLVGIGRAALLLGADPRKVLDNFFETARKQSPDGRDAYLAIGDLALEKHDYELAAKQFQAGLKRFPGDPDMTFGLARAYEPSNRRLMVENIEATWKTNANHTGAMLLLIDHLIDGEEYEEADKLIDRALAVNPWLPDAWAYRAVIQHLRNDSEGEKKARANALKYYAANPKVDFIIGQDLSQKYRFAEGAACQRRALAADTNYVPSKAQLAQDLLRLGDEADGWQLAEEAHKQDEYDVTLFNLVTLRDKLKKFATVTNADFIVRMATNEAPIYGADVLSLLSRAKSNLTAKFGVTLARPTTVEIFPEQKDFGVRTFGMPDNPGYLGVCFGPVITANSPAAQSGHPANWQSVLWHEFTHVITLQITRNRMPRWLSEGISVFEEIEANPAWGQRMNASYREMILHDELTPVGELSSAFIAPKTPLHLQFAYYESELVVEFIVKQFGFPALQAILRDLGEGVTINKAIADHTQPMAQLEPAFAKFARQRAEGLAPGLDWEKPTPAELRSTNWLAMHPTNYWALDRQARELIAEQKFNEARPFVERLVSLFPTQAGAESGWLLLARVNHGLGDTNGERSALELLAAMDDDAVDVFMRLCEIGGSRGDWKLVGDNAERALAVNPLIAPPHRALARAADELRRDEVAIRENRVLLKLDPPNSAEVHFNLARLLHRAHDDGKAKREVLEALEETPRYREAHALLRTLASERKAGP